MVYEGLKYVLVYLSSTLKFVLGPILGVVYDIPLFLVMVLTVLGMMTTIYIITFFGDYIKKFTSRFFVRKKIFTKRNRRFVRSWNKYGLKGVCLLTPIIFTPPIGGLLVNILGRNKSQIIKWMWISACIWSVVITVFIKYTYKFIDYAAF